MVFCEGYYTAGCGKLFHPGDPADFDPPSWNEPRCAPNATNPGATGSGAKNSGFPYYGQGSCPYDNHNRSLVPAPGWGCPVDRAKYPQCNGRTGRHDPGNMTCFPDELTLGTALDFLQKGAAQFNASGAQHSMQRPFWIGVGFVKPHYPQVSISNGTAEVQTAS